MAKSEKTVDKGEQEANAGIEETIQKLGETDDPGILYVIERWGMVEDQVVIETRITGFDVTWQMHRGNYQSDELKGRIKVETENLKCDIVIQKPTAEIIESEGDLGIVGQVYRRFVAEARLQTHEAMKDHMNILHLAKNEKAARVDAKEVPTPTTTSVEL